MTLLKAFLKLSVCGLLMMSSVVCAEVDNTSDIKAFGMHTVAGQGGKIIKVTNLNSEGQGSLRWAVSQPEKRIVVFEVGGVIDLAKNGIRIEQPFLTIAGETAPAPGITIIRGGLRVSTNDVRIRHLMIRPGDNNEAARSGWESDGISVSGKDAFNVHIDHCSLTWAIDENLSASGPRDKGHAATSHDITFSNNIVAEALDNSTHIKGRHSKGLLVHDYVQNVAVIANLFAHNDRRNPYFKGHTSGVVVNNLMYNLGNAAVQVGYIEDEYSHIILTPENPKIAVVGNRLIYGKSSYSDLPLVAYQGDVYMRDNSVTNLQGKPMPQAQGVINQLTSAPVWPSGFQAKPETVVEKSVLATAGARPWDRDPIDQRIINSVINRTGQLIDSQNEVGGYPQYPMTTRKLIVPDKGLHNWLAGFTH